MPHMSEPEHVRLKRSPSQLPHALVESILSGDCVAFVGAGFSAGRPLAGKACLLA